jgi:hypothetical protein
MKKLIALIALAAAATSAFAATAYWTGASQIATSVTGRVGFNCEYNYAGRTFWVMFEGSCPSRVNVN